MLLLRERDLQIHSQGTLSPPSYDLATANQRAARAKLLLRSWVEAARSLSSLPGVGESEFLLAW